MSGDYRDELGRDLLGAPKRLVGRRFRFTSSIGTFSATVDDLVHDLGGGVWLRLVLVTPTTVESHDCWLNLAMVVTVSEHPAQARPPAEEEAVRPRGAIVTCCQRIRAGWLPHRLAAGTWWWGRPAADDGYRLWSEGFVPSMSVVEPMSSAEVDAWGSALSLFAPERTP